MMPWRRVSRQWTVGCYWEFSFSSDIVGGKKGVITAVEAVHVALRGGVVWEVVVWVHVSVETFLARG